MKKLILPLLLLVAFGMLAAVESDPSAVVGYVKYDMVVGNNLVAMPMEQTFTTTTEFGVALGEDLNTVMVFNQTSQSWEAAVNYGEGYWDPEYPVATNSVLFCNATVATTYFSIGPLPAAPATYTFVVGNNTAMIPLNRSDLTNTTQVGLTMGEDVNTIMVYNQGSQSFEAAVNYGEGYWDPEYPVAIGTPLFLNATNAITWPARSASSPFNTSSK